MSSCSRCATNSRCGCDFSSRAEQKPSLVSIEVVSDLLFQAVRNSARRAQSVAEGGMTPEELQEADERLAGWLGSTFLGENPHFMSGEDWNPYGLSLYLQDALSERFLAVTGEVPASPEAVVESAVSLLMADLYELLHRAARRGVSMQGVEDSPAAAAFINRWARLLTGAPEELVG